MKRIANRTIASLLVVAILIAGFGLYVVRYINDGADWAAFAVNRHVYYNGQLASGTIISADGVILASVENGQRIFAEDRADRRAMLHVVGDADGNIGTGFISSYDTQLMSYNFISGVYSRTGEGNTLYSTIRADVCRVALDALGYNRGAVVVYNYKTGEVICMVSAPTFDPANPPTLEDEGGDYYNGVYINRALSSTFTPGSIFKLVTLAAAIENLDDLWDMTFHCTGKIEIGYDVITCTESHGDIDIYDALAHSCNVAFSELALLLGGDLIYDYAKQAGLLDSFEVSRIPTAAGQYEIPADGTSDLAWSGIGQFNDLVNPTAAARFMGAIANHGIARAPKLVDRVTTPGGIPTGFYGGSGRTRLLSADTADIISEMMRYNVVDYYGEWRFPDLPICAKSGTAEIEVGDIPHAWFVGFLDDPQNPYAFAVFVENGGWGVTVAGAVANRVLQQAVYGGQ